MLDRIKRIFPIEVRRRLKRNLLHINDMQARLENLKRAGFRPTGAIDGGAYEGDWTKAFWSVWPTTPCWMIEPQFGQSKVLRDLAKRVRGSQVHHCALSDIDGRESFSLDGTNSRLGSGDSKKSIEVDVCTLDSVLRGEFDFQPNLLKLDLQGFELAALDGCADHLNQFEVIILEISILRIGDVPIFREVDQYLAQRRYRVYDLLPTYFRPLDGALWQVDAFYVQESSCLISSRSWA